MQLLQQQYHVPQTLAQGKHQHNGFLSGLSIIGLLFRVAPLHGPITQVSSSWLGAASRYRVSVTTTNSMGFPPFPDWLLIWVYLDDPGGRQVPLPFLCQLLRNGYPVVHHEGPALAAQVDSPEEEVLLMLVYLPRKRGFNNLPASMQQLAMALVLSRYACALSDPPPPLPPNNNMHAATS